jgi:hypothetical protein
MSCKIRNARTKADLAALMGEGRSGFGAFLFGLGVSEDLK